jgi:hypothetical protein
MRPSAPQEVAQGAGEIRLARGPDQHRQPEALAGQTWSQPEVHQSFRVGRLPAALHLGVAGLHELCEGESDSSRIRFGVWPHDRIQVAKASTRPV